MPGPCGGPGDGTNEGTKDGKCTKEGKRHGKGEHADKWCCTGNRCREALGVTMSAAATQAAAKPAAAEEPVDKAAAAGAAAAGAAAAGAAAAGGAGASAAGSHSDRSAAVRCACCCGRCSLRRVHERRVLTSCRVSASQGSRRPTQHRQLGNHQVRSAPRMCCTMDDVVPTTRRAPVSQEAAAARRSWPARSNGCR